MVMSRTEDIVSGITQLHDGDGVGRSAALQDRDDDAIAFHNLRDVDVHH